jgi:two-component system phosphate regulon response regulator PhoB
MKDLGPATMGQLINERAPRILVVEDDPSLALLLTYNLESEGFIVEHVDRGDEACLRLAEAPPDLVLLDWLLPGVSGLAICRRLWTRDETRERPVIMLNAAAKRTRGFTVSSTGPTIMWSSPSRCSNSSFACTPCCAARDRHGWRAG